jgi:hypothetical protein
MFCRTTRYLNTGGLFRSHCPELLERIIALGMQVDATHFHLLQQGRSPAPRQQQQEEGKDSDAARVARLSKLLATPSMGGDDGDDDDDSSPREEQGEEQQVAGSGSGAESGGGGDEGEGVVMDGRVSGVGAVRLAPRCVEYHTMVGGAGGLASCGTGSLLPLRPAGVAADDDDGANEHEDGAPAVAATAGGGDSSSGSAATSAALWPKQRKEALATAHYDQGSVLTVDIMLADPSGFEGGQLSTLEVDGECRQHRFEQGDALVFVSHKYQ